MASNPQSCQACATAEEHAMHLAELAGNVNPHPTEPPTIRQQFAVYASREEAIAAGWPDAEFGCWQKSPKSTALFQGWIALNYEEL